MTRRRRFGSLSRAAVSCALVAASACDQTGPGFRAVSVEIVPASLLFDAIGADSLMQARVVDGDGRELLATQVRWTSTDPGIAAIDEGGLLTAVSPGTTTVRATASGLGFLEATASAPVEVAPATTAMAVVSGAGQTGTVGVALPIPVSIMATDRLGEPVVGQAISFTPTPGSGQVTPTVVATDAQGVAAAEWTLGPLAGGLHSLVVAADGGGGLDPVQIDALALAGPPAVIEVDAGADQFGVRGTRLDQPVVVRILDGFANSIGGVEVHFAVAEGEGAALPTVATTDLTGVASSEWTLGPTVGTQSLQIDAGAASARVDAVATEVPAALAAATATSLSGTVASPVSPPPSVVVVDAQGAPVQGVAVTYEVTAGGGTIEVGSPAGAAATGFRASGAPAVVRSDPEGRATVTAWRLGTVAGIANQVLRASVAGVGSVVFTASADAGPPASLSVVGGDAQTGAVTTELPEPITVRVADAFDNPVAGVEVGFAPSAGYAAPPIQATDAAGTASTRWTLGPVAGTYTLEATSAGAANPAQVTANATGSAATCALTTPSAGFDLEVCWVGTVDPVVAAALDQAVARWESLVVGDLLDVAPNADHASCVTGAPWVSGTTLDDLVLYVTVDPIDGAGGGLAGALPCFVREGNSLPTFARMRIDRDDVGPLSSSGQLVDVLLHEIGHALGFGTLWTPLGLITDPALATTGPPPDTHFTGAAAINAFDAAGGANRTVGAKVPVQNRGGGGVVDVHWRESVLGSELMTSDLNVGVPNPLSRITVESLADMGYVVAPDQSDPYVVPFPNLPVVGPGDAPLGITTMGQDIWWGPIGVVDAAGTLVRILRFQPRP